MSPIVSIANSILSSFTVISQIIFIVALFIFIKEKNVSEDKQSKIFQFISRHSLLLAFLVSLIATSGSLFYSEIAHYEPCKFCWFQRIFMYPQTILLGTALLRKDLKIWTYSLPLSIIGAFIAGNHYYLQTTGTSIIPCSAVGQSVSCSKVFVMHFGYITIPLMALSAFLVMIVSMLYVRKTSKTNNS